MLLSQIRPSELQGSRPHASTPPQVCRCRPARQLQPSIAPHSSAHARQHQVRAAPAAAAPPAKDDRQLHDALLARFKAADLDGNGVIDKKELKHLLECVDNGNSCDVSGAWLTDDEVDKVMQQYDADGSGDISFEEFARLAEDGVLLEGKVDEYEEAFRAVDTAGSGKIGATQIAQLFEHLNHPLTYEKLVEIMGQYDVDHSGQIEFGEFLRMFRNQLLDLREVLDYLHLNPSDSQQTASEPSVRDRFPGEVGQIFGAADLDAMLAEDKDALVVLMSTLTWCRPCKGLAKPFQNLAEHYRGTVHFCKLYGNTNEDCKSLFKDRLGTKVTPTFVFFQNGEVTHTHTGANKAKLEHYVRQHIPAAGRPAELFAGPQQTPTGGWK